MSKGLSPIQQQILEQERKQGKLEKPDWVREMLKRLPKQKLPDYKYPEA